MKNKLFLALCVWAAAMISCSKDHDVVEVESSNVSFTYSIDDYVTRVTGSSFGSGDAISVFAKNGDSYYAEAVNYALNGSTFTSEDPIALTKSISSLSYTAVYPYSAASTITTTFETALDQSTEDAYDASDLLTANVTTTSSQTPALAFDHSLSKVNLVVGSSDVDFSNAEIIVMAANEVDCNFEAETFVASGSTVAITPYTNSVGSYSAIVAPQVVAAGSDFVTLNVDGETYTWTLDSDINLGSGEMLTVTMSIIDGDITFDGDVADWNDGGEIDLGGPNTGDDETMVGTIAFDFNDIGSDYILIDVDPSEGVGNYTFGIVSAERFESNYYSDINYVAEMIIYTYFNNNISVDEADYWAIYKGAATIDVSDVWTVSADTDYVVVVFGIDSEGNINTEVASDTCYTGSTYDGGGSEAYNKWIGEWQVTSSSSYNSGGAVSFYATISGSEADKSYILTNWDISDITRPAFEINFNSTTGELEFPSYAIRITDDTDDTVNYTHAFQAFGMVDGYGSTAYIISGDYTAMTGTLSSDDLAYVVGSTGTISSGNSFTITHVEPTATTASGTVYTYNRDPEYADCEDPIGPYTLVRVTSSTDAEGTGFTRLVSRPTLSSLGANSFAKSRIVFFETYL